MWSFSLIVGGFVLGLIAFSFVIGAPIFAVPLVLVGVGVIAAVDFQRRRKQAKQLGGFREEAKAEQVEFTERDKQTLVSE
jgi:predicted membrane protein